MTEPWDKVYLRKISHLGNLSLKYTEHVHRNFKSEKPKPFHYPVLLANRSSIPTKPYSSKNCSKNVSNGSAYEDNVITKHVTSFVSVVGTNCNNQQNSNSNEESCKNIETSYHTTSNCHQHSNNNNSNNINSFNFNNNNNNNNNNTDYNDNNSSNVNVDFQINISTIVTNGAFNSEGNSKHTISTTSKATELSDEPNGKCVNENSDNLITNLKLSDVNFSITDSSLTDSEKTTTSADQFHVTTTDLEGFWDLVIIQVDDVEASFKELNEIRDNGWKEKIKEEVLSPSIKVDNFYKSNLYVLVINL
ncbi:hypothetical protein HELRODRAFT_167795 [Helobdella robusta]|uniref:Uncharacterized protein n=1 Tax=Helobdella robusta TaxID=6412 RepID=T1EZT5_HELRO|nr:hypothetical protein HELRODRAFT_167795 [Helobdella robusta]ESO09963.1 hypothetical protein HELRODRAFT_167795 [Helobdella robusta]